LIAEKNQMKCADFKALIIELLSDEPRPGKPARFSPEQISQILSIACEKPEDSGRPITHWTSQEIAFEAQKRGIVTSISDSYVRKLLKKAIHPHKIKYWLTSQDKTRDKEAYDLAIREVCNVYTNALRLGKNGVHIISVDEKSGMQAKEWIRPNLPVTEGIVERQDPEYVRHGTLCLIGNLDIVTGEIISPTIGETRTEKDYVEHIAQTVDTDPEGEWIFINDQLNTHQSTSLVRWVAEQCQIKKDLGYPRKRGILKNMASRKKFLESKEHRIRFVYTPHHASWLNQIEIWFSILSRKVLKRGSFSSKEHLREKVLSFIGYYNLVFAKPFKWTYTGQPLEVD